MVHWNEWRENEVLGHSRSAVSVTSYTGLACVWISASLVGGRWQTAWECFHYVWFCMCIYMCVYVYVTFKWNRLDTHTCTHDVYTSLVSLNFSRKLFDMSWWCGNELSKLFLGIFMNDVIALITEHAKRKFTAKVFTLCFLHECYWPSTISSS